LKSLAILGSTGSIGSNALDVVRQHRDRFEVVALAAGNNIDALLKQMREFRPRLVSVADQGLAEKLEARWADQDRVEIFWGPEGLERIATAEGADLVVSALTGSVGLIPTMRAIDMGKDVALANKEVLVMAGELVLQQARDTGSKLLPVDSELSAIFQAMRGHHYEEVRRILLTASGGPFLGWSREQLSGVSPEKAMGHPNWNMGKKVTLDSATLMNKGLEVIETRWFFDIPPGNIEVYIHPQSIVHSMVEYHDGSVIAQMGIPDMRIPIAYAMSYPQRIQNTLPSLDLLHLRTLTFLPPDRETFPCLGLAYRALDQGGTYPTVLNAANEVAGQAFLNRRIRFQQISGVVERALESHIGHPVRSLEDVIEADAWTRKECSRWVDGG